MDLVIEFDQRVSYRIYKYFHTSSTSVFLSFFQLFSISGDGLLWFPLPILLLLLPLHKSLQNLILHLLLGSVLCAIVELVLKQFIQRQRPSYDHTKPRFIAAEHYSCPSGHCIRAAYIYLFLCSNLSKKWHSPLYIWYVSTCFSRIVVGRHYVLDCIFGVVLGHLIYSKHNFVQELIHLLL